ncbi:MAG: anion permease [Rhodobiaceae bacterium]|nr:anion permease [Rhodobiaceae bacterium]
MQQGQTSGAAARLRSRVRLPLSRLFFAVLLAAALALLVLPPPEGVPPVALRTGALALVSVGLWSTGLIAAWLASALFFFAAMVLGLAPAQIVFSGFHSTAIWLVFGGMIIGMAVHRSGLGARTVRYALSFFHGGYLQLAAALVVVGLLLAFIVPSAMGRMLLLMPMVFALAEQLGFDADSDGRAGMVLAATLGTTLPAFAILPANVPNMALIGAAESIYGVHFQYGGYMLLNFPVMGTLSLAAIPALVTLFFGEEARPAAAAAGHERWSRDEKVLVAIVLATVAMWTLDFAHGLSPAWVALGAAILCLMPGIGVLPATAIREADFGPWIFVAGVIGLGAVANHTGLADAIGRHLLEIVEFEGASGPFAFAAMAAIGMAVALVTCLPAAPAIMTPLAAAIAAKSGWALDSVLMAQVPTWIVFPLPYQAPPLLVALSLGAIAIPRVLPLMASYFAFGVVVILPLQYLWGHFLGVYG